jgi:hypothetical protein
MGELEGVQEKSPERQELVSLFSICSQECILSQIIQFRRTTKCKEKKEREKTGILMMRYVYYILKKYNLKLNNGIT